MFGDEIEIKRVNQRIKWWSIKRWCDVIHIPTQQKNVNLVICDAKSFRSATLLNFTPEQLETNIQAYRNKTAWRRWVQRLFSSINQQIEALSYYKKCLNVRNQHFSEQKLAIETSAIAEPPSNPQLSVVTLVSMAQNKQATRIEPIKKLEELEQAIKKVREKGIALQEQQEQIRYQQRQSKENGSLTEETSTQETRASPSP